MEDIMYEDAHLESDYEDRYRLDDLYDDAHLDDYGFEPIVCEECGEEFVTWAQYDKHWCVLTDPDEPVYPDDAPQEQPEMEDSYAYQDYVQYSP